MPRTGLNIPIVSALDEAGNLIESDQRRIVRHAIQQGRGADSLFICGTTGEYNRLNFQQRRRLLEIGIEETRLVNSLLPKDAVLIEAWAGITAPTRAETLESLELAAQLKAEMAVIAPYAISDLPSSEIVGFFTNEIAERINSNESLVIGLYDNPDIAATQNAGKNLSDELIAELKKLPFVACLKASVNRTAFRNYVKHFARGTDNDFTLYAGNAGLIFEIGEIQHEAGLENSAVAIAGVVSGTANVFPREWQQAWRAVVKHDTKKVSVFSELLTEFESLTGFPGENGYSSKLIGGIKQAMFHLGIINSPCVAPGTPALTKIEAQQLNENLDNLLSETRAEFEPEYLSVYENEKENFESRVQSCE